MNLSAYFERIGYAGSTEPTLETLRGVHRAHALSVPFENLDIHLKRPIILDEDLLFDKLVTHRRGGFCYEQNGLFAAILHQMGYRVTLLEARVYSPDGSLGIPFDHLTLLVELEERWLADVGFGDNFLEPLRFDDPSEQIQGNKAYRLVHDGETGIYSTRRLDGDWQDEFWFSLTPHTLADFIPGCQYHQTSPDSPFTRKRICSRITKDGFITVSELRLIITQNGVREEHPLADESEFHAALKEHFGVEL
jgi:N-hydroxyarylamine O-acetyltransferase